MYIFLFQVIEKLLVKQLLLVLSVLKGTGDILSVQVDKRPQETQIVFEMRQRFIDFSEYKRCRLLLVCKCVLPLAFSFQQLSVVFNCCF